MKVLEMGSKDAFATDVEMGSGLLWLPYKNILDIVTRAIQDGSTGSFTDLDACVKRSKGDFVSFLNHKGKSGADREIIKKSTTEGIFLRGQDARQQLHPQLVNETMLLSDIFEINEFLALDLLATAEAIKEEYPGWARGLIAVYLYFEGRLCMIQALSSMIAAIPGWSWQQEHCFPRVYSVFKNVLGYVFKNDMIDKLIDLFSKSDVKTVMESLDSSLALGDWRHRHEINRMLTGLREGVAFLIFAVSAQQDLPWKDVYRILEYLRTNIRLDNNGKLDKAMCSLIDAVMFSIMHRLSLSTYDRNFARDLLKYFKDCGEPKTSEDGGFHCPELLEFFRLTFQIMTQKAVSETNVNSLHAGMGSAPEILKDDEEYYFKKDVFAFMRDHLFREASLYTFEEIIVKKYHELFTDFICFLPMKVKEMKVRSDDAVKTATLYQSQGFQKPSNLPQDYESFLECLGMFYLNDEDCLSMDFFDPDIKHLSLNKLARGACMETPTLFISNAKFLRGLAKGAPEDVFDLLKQNGHNFALEHFFESIMQYLASFGSNARVGFTGTNLFSSETFQRVVHDPMRVQMNPNEIEGICAYLDLVRVMCENSQKICSYFSNQKLSWIRILLETAKIRGIPRDIRAKMISAAASMIYEKAGGDVVTSIWEMFYSVKLIGQDGVDFKDELEEHESRLETYPLTMSMLKLISSIINCRFRKIDDDGRGADVEGVGNLDSGSFEPYVAYVRDTVLLKTVFRSFKNQDDRWETAAMCLDVLSKLLDYVPQLMFQLLCGSPFLHTVLSTLSECVRNRESVPGPLSPVEKCSYACLNLLRRALQRQSYFLHRKELSAVRQEAVIVGIQELLMKIVPETGRPEYMVSVLKFIDTLQPTRHKQAALDILWLTLSERDDIDSHLYASVIMDTSLISLLRYMFINILYEPPSSDETKKTVLRVIRASVVHSAPNFAMMLLGVDKKIDFQNAGVAGYPRTVLHAILDNARVLPDTFITLLALIRDPRLWNPLLRYLKTNHFLSNFVRDNFPCSLMDIQDVGYLLKCIAMELKTTPAPGPLSRTIIGEGSASFQEMLNLFDFDDEPVEMPALEYFDQQNVMQAMKSCEYFDPKLKVRVIRVDMLETLLKEEILKLEKTAVLKLRHTVHAEAKDVVKFASDFNNSRWKEASRAVMLDGWRQCLEVIVLNPETLRMAGVDFVNSTLLILLNKMVGINSPREYFCRLAAETTLSLCSVLKLFKDQVNTSTLNVIVSHICKWIAEEQSPRVRATLYASVLHVVKMLKTTYETGTPTVSSFSLILENLCKDCCQAKEIGKMQAMYMMGEVIRLTADKGLIGGDYIGTSNYEQFMTGQQSSVLQTSTFLNQTMPNMTIPSPGGTPTNRYGSLDFGRVSPVGMGTSVFMRSSSLLKPNNKTNTSLREHHTSSGSHINIMSYMFAKGFLGNIVNAIVTADDMDLIKLFSSQPMQANMRAVYVFEAKLSLLCRFASTGKRSLLFLMDTNIVPKLADMRVLQMQYFPDGSDTGVPGIADSKTTFQDFALNTKLTRRAIMESLYSDILKLFHSMADSSPKNVLLVEQIWHFLTVHDLPLSQLVNRSVIEADEKNVACNLLLGLMTKIARLLPAVAYSGKTYIMSRILDVLKIQAVHPTYSDFRLSCVREVLLLLYNYAHNTEGVKEMRKKGITRKFRLILENKLTHDLLSGNPEQEINVGVLGKIIYDFSATVITWGTAGNISKNKMDLAASIMEIAMTLLHDHIEVFLTDQAYKSNAKQFCEDFIPTLDNKLSKFVAEAAKAVEKGEFIEMMLLRIRRMVHAPYKN